MKLIPQAGAAKRTRRLADRDKTIREAYLQSQCHLLKGGAAQASITKNYFRDTIAWSTVAMLPKAEIANLAEQG